MQPDPSVTQPQMQTPDLSAVVYAQAEEMHKRFAMRIVIPAMSLTSLGFYMAVVQADRTAFVVAAAGIVVAILNAWISTLTGSWRESKFRPRADTVDAVRWGFNIAVFDSTITMLLQPSTSTIVISWTILLIAASADMYRQAYRTMIMVLGVSTAALMVFYAPSDVLPLREQIFAVFAITTVIVMFLCLEAYWANEMRSRMTSQQMEAEAEYRIKGLTRDALLGMQMRTISHELANLILILDLSSQRQETFNFEKVRKAIYFIKRINRLVLRDLGHSAVEERSNFESILGYVQLLVAKEVGREDLEVEIDVSDEAKKFEFLEYSGSLFLILRNLMKNAADSTREIGSQAPIRLSASVSDKLLRISVSDSGSGMDESFLNNLLAGAGKTTKIHGSGIGFRFVVEQCEKNQFKLGGTSKVGAGTVFTIEIPHADRVNRDDVSTVG